MKNFFQTAGAIIAVFSSAFLFSIVVDVLFNNTPVQGVYIFAGLVVSLAVTAVKQAKVFYFFLLPLSFVFMAASVNSNAGIEKMAAHLSE